MLRRCRRGHEHTPHDETKRCEGYSHLLKSTTTPQPRPARQPGRSSRKPGPGAQSMLSAARPRPRPRHIVPPLQAQTGPRPDLAVAGRGACNGMPPPPLRRAGILQPLPLWSPVTCRHCDCRHHHHWCLVLRLLPGKAGVREERARPSSVSGGVAERPLGHGAKGW